MAQEVEHVLGKDGVTGSNPVSSSTRVGMVSYSFLLHYADILRCRYVAFARYAHSAKAQQVERILGKDGVTGSNPVSSSKNRLFGRFFVFLLKFWNF